ncbi:uncharacterized protein METZ01_LOCUS173760, partial [marine metagenome]
QFPKAAHIRLMQKDINEVSLLKRRTGKNLMPRVYQRRKPKKLPAAVKISPKMKLHSVVLHGNKRCQKAVY